MIFLHTMYNNILHPACTTGELTIEPCWGGSVVMVVIFSSIDYPSCKCKSHGLNCTLNKEKNKRTRGINQKNAGLPMTPLLSSYWALYHSSSRKKCGP